MKDRITDVPTGLSMDEAYKTYVETLFEINENERLHKENNEGSQVLILGRSRLIVGNV